MNTLKLLELKDLVYFTDDVYIDKNFLIFAGGTQFTQDVKQLLCEWQFTVLYTKGGLEEAENEEERRGEEEPASKEKETVPAAAEKKPEEPEKKKLSGEAVEKIYNQFLLFTTETYNTYRNTQELEVNMVIRKMEKLRIFVEENRQTILMLQALRPYSSDDFLVHHSLRSAIFALVIGMQLKMSHFQLTELAAACLMHEIGLMHISEEIYTKSGKLTEEEKKYLYVHPVLSCKILKKAKFSLPICLGTLDHHERENGTGYPQKLTSEKISLYGKIIAVVCSYEAMIGQRKYKEALEPSQALLNILRKEQSQYDEEVLRALLYALSFFPIGCFVCLSNDTIGQVIDNNPDDPRFPLVRVVNRTGDTATPEAIRTNMSGIRILRPARKEEWEAALNEKK